MLIATIGNILIRLLFFSFFEYKILIVHDSMIMDRSTRDQYTLLWTDSWLPA